MLSLKKKISTQNGRDQRKLFLNEPIFYIFHRIEWSNREKNEFSIIFGRNMQDFFNFQHPFAKQRTSLAPSARGNRTLQKIVENYSKYPTGQRNYFENFSKFQNSLKCCKNNQILSSFTFEIISFHHLWRFSWKLQIFHHTYFKLHISTLL